MTSYRLLALEVALVTGCHELQTGDDDCLKCISLVSYDGEPDCWGWRVECRSFCNLQESIARKFDVTHPTDKNAGFFMGRKSGGRDFRGLPRKSAHLKIREEFAACLRYKLNGRFRYVAVGRCGKIGA